MMRHLGFWVCRIGLHRWSKHRILGCIRWCRRCGYRK